jgi:hypothetical protein
MRAVFGVLFTALVAVGSVAALNRFAFGKKILGTA